MTRPLTVLCGLAAAALAGCASTWDHISSSSFREVPFQKTFSAEDPMTVLRTKVSGADRAEAMRRLKEPARTGKTPEEQDEALQTLGTAATTDPSPVVRTAAIDALGRFKDPRAVTLLVAAYQKADGLADRPTVLVAPPTGGLMAASATKPAIDPLAAYAESGLPPEFAATLRSRTLTALANTDRPEAVDFLARIATGDGKTADDPTLPERDVRAAAVRGLGQMRSKTSVAALARVLSTEHDVVLTKTAHEGLVELTGKNLPADPAQWNAVVQAGGDTAPPPNAVQRAVGTFTGR